MEKPSTLKNSFKQGKVSESPKQLNLVTENQSFEPSDDTINLLLSFSKALSTETTKSLGTVYNVLN